MAGKSNKNQLARFLIKKYFNKKYQKTKNNMYRFFDHLDVEKLFNDLKADKSVWFEKIEKPFGEGKVYDPKKIFQELSEKLSKYKSETEIAVEKLDDGYIKGVIMPGYPKEIIKVKTVDNTIHIDAKNKGREFSHSFTFKSADEYLESNKLVDGILYITIKYKKKEAKVAEFEVK